MAFAAGLWLVAGAVAVFALSLEGPFHRIVAWSVAAFFLILGWIVYDRSR